MATHFRNAVVALLRAKKEPTRDNINKALTWTTREYARGGSFASKDIMHEAVALENEYRRTCCNHVGGCLKPELTCVHRRAA